MDNDLQQRIDEFFERRRNALSKVNELHESVRLALIRSIDRGFATIPRVCLISVDADSLPLLLPVARAITSKVAKDFGLPSDGRRIPDTWLGAEGWAHAVFAEEKRQRRDAELSHATFTREIVRKTSGDDAAEDQEKVEIALKAISQSQWEQSCATSKPLAWPGARLHELDIEARAAGVSRSVARRKWDPTSTKAIQLACDLALVDACPNMPVVLKGIDRAKTRSGALAVVRRAEKRALGAGELPGSKRFAERVGPLLARRQDFEEGESRLSPEKRRKFYDMFSKEWAIVSPLILCCCFCGTWYARSDRRRKACPRCVAAAYQRERRAAVGVKNEQLRRENVEALLQRRTHHLLEEHRRSKFTDCPTCADLDFQISNARGRRRKPKLVAVGNILPVEERRQAEALGKSR
jgi:hypothetical protein